MIGETCWKKPNKQVNFSDVEKLDKLNKYAYQVSDVLDEKKWYDFLSSSNRDTVKFVRWDVNDQNFAYEESRYRYTLPFLVKTATHEARHQYQGHAHLQPYHKCQRNRRRNEKNWDYINCRNYTSDWHGNHSKYD